MIKRFNEYRLNESSVSDGIDYSEVDPGKTGEDIMIDAVKQYHYEIDKGLDGVAKVVSVSGFADETDSDLEFILSDGNRVDVVFKFHPFNSKMTVTVFDENGDMLGEKTYQHGKDSENRYVKDAGDMGVNRMLKEIYLENGLLDPVKFEIELPRELFGNGIYYDIDPESDQHRVGFETEQAAKDWISALQITKI